MARLDHRSLPLSTTSDLAAERYREGVDLLLSAWPGAAEALEEAIAADPHFALAHAALARLQAIGGEVAAARASIARATELADRGGTPRERSHVATLALAVTGQSAKALEGALAHADAWPRDALVLSLVLGAFGLLAFSGMPDHDQARVDLCERHAGHFASDDWWFLTYRGWSHAENGAVRHGRGLIERGFALRRNNAHGAHALSHAMYEGGAGEEAEALIADWLPIYDRSGMLHGHIAWHAALSALERDDPQHALRIYAEHVQPSVTASLPINVITDTVSSSSSGRRAPPNCRSAFQPLHLGPSRAADLPRTYRCESWQSQSQLGDRVSRNASYQRQLSLTAGIRHCERSEAI